MNDFIADLISKMPESPTELTNHNLKKIKEYMPVPNDFEILWADINAFGGYPSGLVMTSRGMVFKSPRPKHKGKKLKRIEEYQIPYQVILWEYFDPSEYEIERQTQGNCFLIKKDNTIVSVFNNTAVIDFFNKYIEKLCEIDKNVNQLIEDTIISEIDTLNFESVAFNSAYGEDQSKTGHGIYAEEAGSMLDRLNGESSTVVGRDNAKNGPDKIVNGAPVQCKFCKSANSSVGACFKKNPQTGKMEYRYYDLKSGKPMMVEVPADQYEKALEIMRQKILDGQVPGVTDPEKAKELVRRSKLTYTQARNLAKPGTFESLTYDAVTGTVSCSFAAGVSALASFGMVYWRTKDWEKARDAAIDTAISVFGPTLVANIISNQIARTGLSRAMIPLSEKIVDLLGYKIVQKIINARRTLLGQSKIYGSAASKSLAKALRSNAIVEGISFVVFSVPDTYRLFSKKISGAQYTKNMLSMSASVAASIASTYGAGVAAGAIGEKIGKKIGKNMGAVIGFVAGAGGGMIAGIAVNKLTGLWKEDDCVITTRLFSAVMINMTIDYLLSEEEGEKVIKLIEDDVKKIRNFQVSIMTSDRQYYDIERFLAPYFDSIVGERETITKMDENIEFISSERDIPEIGGII